MLRILVLEDDADLRQGLCDLLQLVGVESCLALGSFEALLAHEDEALRSELALIDVNLGPGVPSGIDAYDWLRGRGYRGKVVFLTGHARFHPLVQAAQKLDVEILEKPVEGAVLESLAQEPAR